MIKEQSDTFQYSLLFSDLNIQRNSIEKCLGYHDSTPPDIVSEVIDSILDELPNYTNIQCGFVILPSHVVKINSSSIQYDSIVFHTGLIISKRLRKSCTFAVFVATAGNKFERWSRELQSASGGSDDMMKTFIVDTIGSEIAERTADWLDKQLSADVKKFGWKITNRYSPGYCDWNVSEQQKLFSILPPNFCNITLTESSLMIPIKSVSGIIGLGPDVKKESYECSICDMEDCFRRKEEKSI